MPYILEEALYRVYMDKGWDLITGKNNKGSGPRSFPTLSEFCNSVEEIVNGAGYDQETTQNIRTALRVRLGSLRAGAKGFMLDTRYSIDFNEILKYPSVFELGKIGDDEEKAFIMGLLLIKLFEYFSLRSQIQREPGIKLLLVIEEAHRLLRNTPPEMGNIEVSNIRGRAVEGFCNLLAEMRALGVGIIVCEQIPTKLAPDVIKNTNLKILFRMVSDEDRKAIGESMNMTDEQRRAVATFKTGEATVYTEGVNEPFLVRVPNFREYAIREDLLQSQDIGSHMKRLFYSNHPQLSSTNNLKKHEILEDSEFIEAFNRLLLTLIEGEEITMAYNELIEIIERSFRLSSYEDGVDYIHLTLQEMADRTFESKAKLYDFSLGDIDALVSDFSSIIKTLREQLREGKEINVNQDIEALILAFQSKYKELTKQKVNPYLGCKGCGAKCLYRYEVNNLIRDEILANDWEAILNRPNSNPEEIWKRFAKVTLD
ncbi:MAG: ATP-binding protein, partial [Thermodesulfobacteriota bacterium]